MTHRQIRMQRTAVFSQASCQIPSPIVCRRPKLHGGRLARVQVMLQLEAAPLSLYPRCLRLGAAWCSSALACGDYGNISYSGSPCSAQGPSPASLRPAPSFCNCGVFAQSSSIAQPRTATAHHLHPAAPSSTTPSIDTRTPHGLSPSFRFLQAADNQTPPRLNPDLVSHCKIEKRAGICALACAPTPLSISRQIPYQTDNPGRYSYILNSPSFSLLYHAPFGQQLYLDPSQDVTPIVHLDLLRQQCISPTGRHHPPLAGESQWTALTRALSVLFCIVAPVGPGHRARLPEPRSECRRG